MQRVLFSVDDDGMAGVVPTVELDDDVGALTQLVSGLALPFVAPLCAQNDHGWHSVMLPYLVARLSS